MIDYEICRNHIEFFNCKSGVIVLATPKWDIFVLAPVFWCKAIGWLVER